MRLYGFWRSSATWRVRIGLNHKGLPYEYVPVHLLRDGGEQHRPEFRQINPIGHVPVLELEIGGVRRRLAESMAILELLDELHPAPALLPRDPFLRARARQLALLVVSGIQPLQNSAVQAWVKGELHGDPAAWTRHWVVRGLDALEVLMAETAGRHAVGDEITLADLCLVPQLGFARRFGVDPASWPTLARVEANAAELPAFVAARPDRQPDAEP
jgi:maleylpyruvate isomerase